MAKPKPNYTEAEQGLVKGYRAHTAFVEGWYDPLVSNLVHFYTWSDGRPISACGRSVGRDIMGGNTSSHHKCRKCTDAITALSRGPELSMRMVPNPAATDAITIAAIEKAQGKPNAGKVAVLERLPTRIGGLYRVKIRQAHHERAAETFKNLYEAAYSNGLEANDNSKVQVDTSITAHDSGMAAIVDKARKLHDARIRLGDVRFYTMVSFIVNHVPFGDTVDRNLPDRARRLAVTALIIDALADLDKLCELWGISTRA